MTSPLRRLYAAAAAAALAVSLAACTAQDPNAAAFRNATGGGNISASGQIVEIPEAERGAPVDFDGVTENGEKLDGADLRGDVVVVNFWYAACGPCRVEAEFLEKVYQDHKDDGVAFVGVNTQDAADTALAFADTYGVTYPSLIDQGDGGAKIAFAQSAPMQTTPTTLVLDKQGRVAARIIGAIDGASVLNTLVTELSEAP